MKTHVRWVVLTLLAGLLLLSACQPAVQAQDANLPLENQQAMSEIPAIDRNQPDEFATATFSMG